MSSPGADSRFDSSPNPGSGPGGSGPFPPPPTSQPSAELRPTIAELFLAFAAMSLSGFGGVLAWARRVMVEQRRWFTAEQFNEAFALCAFLPGGNMINFAVIFGVRMRGPLGALAAVAGLLGPPMILIIAVGALYAHYGDLPALRHALTGVAAAAAGLMLATVAKMAYPLFTNLFTRRLKDPAQHPAKSSIKNPSVVAPLIAVVTFVAIGVVHWPLPLVLLVIVPASIAAAFRNSGMRR
jgi:chromate transporter